MIELIKEKSYSSKDQKFQIFEQKVLYDKFKMLKFNCTIISAKPKEYELNIFLGLNTGNIICLKISKQKSV
jgi:hypothetical protein